MSKGGRPRKVRSRPTSGVGGRVFDAGEKEQLLKIGERYGLDRQDSTACTNLLEKLWQIYGSYCATEQALANQVGAADERFDLQTLLISARKVLTLVRERKDVVEPQRCVSVAANLASSLHSFPNMVNANILDMKERPAFVEARHKLRMNVGRILLWEPYRSDFIYCLEVLIDVCERVDPPEMFTKRPRQARDIFKLELVELYLEFLHPLREAIWRETRRGANDPPPPKSTDQFALEVMKILGVKFESKGVSG